MIDYKYPTIASGATPIGSAGRAPDEELRREERGRKFRVHELDIYSHRERGFKNPTILSIAFEVEDFKKSKIEEIKSYMKSNIEEIKSYMKSKIEEIEEVKDLKFGDSTQVCDSSRVSGATDMGMPFRYPRISIPGPVHYGGGQVQGLDKMTWRRRKTTLICIRLAHL
jgi:hypothetical protein